MIYRASASFPGDNIWTFRAKLVRVIDGDTVDVMIDAGFHSMQLERLRLLGVNCPEVKGPTREAGLAATRYTTDWLLAAANQWVEDEWSLLLQTEKSDVFGRYLSRVWRQYDRRCLNDDLLTLGHAVVDIR